MWARVDWEDAPWCTTAGARLGCERIPAILHTQTPHCISARGSEFRLQESVHGPSHSWSSQARSGWWPQCLRSVACHCITQMSASRRLRGSRACGVRACAQVSGRAIPRPAYLEKGHILWSPRAQIYTVIQYYRIHGIHSVISNARKWPPISPTKGHVRPWGNHICTSSSWGIDCYK